MTEGEDKPLECPTIFNTADAAVLTKMDLAAADSARFCQDGFGMGILLDFLKAQPASLNAVP